MQEKVKNFQIRWAEPIGRPECPYLYRWVFVFFGFSIRLHHWIRSDDKRFMHNHPWDFLTIVLKGGYTDVSNSGKKQYRSDLGKEVPILELDELKSGSISFRKASHCHYVDVPEGGAWTLLFCGRPKQKWGFWIKTNQFFRPLRYFSKYGHPPCGEQ